MAALTGDRNTPRAQGDVRNGGVAASTTIYAGALVMRNAAGYLVKGATATGLTGVGRAEARVVNDGSAGDVALDYRSGTFRFDNSSSTDAITIAEIGEVCFAVDDHTVAKTDGSAARSPAGFVEMIDDQGVWVRFDEAMLKAWADAAAKPAA
ncbi:hypothetical protein DFR49_2287 [Hephaestia caeni]|uniref:Uncharacterized protein n=1 Tax=Hephaestia caeni TaxID=645617 RepID=A0A397PEG8_9SPHN|nr:hypothetical protein [Hephaestia caeni]RIA44051.1 hypothetical protein DFR49_2287 [Hephaestia caeni]